MPSLYNQMQPNQAPAQAGSAEYQSNIVQNTAKQLRPQYDQAIRSARQNMANRGMLRGGLVQGAEAGINQQFNNQMGDVASKAATQSADLGEQERVRQQMRGWQTADMAQALQQRKTDQQQAKDQADQAMWSNLIGTTVGAVGTYYGGQAGGKAARGLTDSATKPNYYGEG